MNYHIVRMNDKIEKIASNYNLTVEEIKVINQHISNWDNIIAGTKLILPNIPERVKDELNDIEPFIEEYYPKISDLYIDKNDDEVKIEEKNDDLISQKNNIPSSIKQKNSVYPKYYHGYYPPYAPYYPYYLPYNIRKIRKK